MKIELTQEQFLVLRNHLYNIEYLEGTYQYNVLKSIIVVKSIELELPFEELGTVKIEPSTLEKIEKSVEPYSQLNEPLTLDWIITTLKKSGCNSKQIVIERLENMSWEELRCLMDNCHLKEFELYPYKKEKEND